MNRLAVLLAALLATPAAAADRPDPAAVARAIDRHVGDRLKAEGVKPAPPADDAAFFRRANLALAGRVPTSSEVRAFLADTDPDKRAKTIDKLLASPAYANHFTTLWRGWLLPEVAANAEAAGVAPGFEAWLRPRIAGNVPFDRFVTELLTAPLDGRRAAARGAPAAGEPTPLAFYVAKDGRPENLAAATSRVFLGIQLECAQCHDHKFAAWTRDQFWGLAAFFGGIDRTNGVLREVFDRRELSIPNTDRAVPATFLDDKEPEWRFKTSPRVTLAAWVTAADNPFFARTAVNRFWGALFGVGIVDPVDDFNEKNPPSHPELLDELAKAFVASGFDVKLLIRSICLSETFQRDSAVTDSRQADVRLYARYPVQALSAEQLYDSLAVAVGGLEPGERAAQRRQFLELFAPPGRKTDAETTIVQALTLMNGRLVGEATTLRASRALGAIVELPGMTPAERVEAVYLAALSRPPRPEELQRALKHVEAGDPGKQAERYADVLWVLLNGVEFRTNH
jgi:hypothetical protein